MFLGTGGLLWEEDIMALLLLLLLLPNYAISPPKDDWFQMVLRAVCSLLAPFEIGYKTVDQCICQRRRDSSALLFEFNHPTSPHIFGCSRDLPFRGSIPHWPAPTTTENTTVPCLSGIITYFIKTIFKSACFLEVIEHGGPWPGRLDVTNHVGLEKHHLQF